MKKSIEAIRNKEMGSCRVSRIFTIPQTTLEQKNSSEIVETKLGRKQVLPCEAENDVAEHCLLMERKFFGLTMADVMCLSYQLAVRNGIKNQFCRRTEKAGKISYVIIHTISVRTPEGLSLSRARGFTPELVT